MRILRRPLSFALIALVLVFVHLKLQPYAEDDAYIHFRIASHLAQSGLPYFNISEPVQASSSSGWTVLLALIFKFTGEVPAVVAVLNGLFVATGAYVYTNLVRRLTKSSLNELTYWMFFVLYLALVLAVGTTLMETAFALLILGIALQFYFNDSPYAFFLFSVAVFFRFELIIVWGVFGLYALVRRRIPIQWIVLACIVGVLPFLIYEVYFFKALIPNTVTAKSVVYQLTRMDSASNAMDLSTPMGFLGYFRTLRFTKYLPLWILPFAVAVEAYRIIRTRPTLDRLTEITYLVLASGLLILASYIASATFIFSWYVPLFSVPIVLGCFVLLAQYRSRLVLIITGVMVIPWGVALVTLMYAAAFNVQFYEYFLDGARVRKYMQVANSLYGEFPSATLMTSEIGGLGYGFPGYITDGAGLISPQALKYHPMKVPEERSVGTTGAIPVKYVDEVNPELLVSYDNFIEAFQRSASTDRYYWIKEPDFLPGDLAVAPDGIWNSQYLNVYIRKDLLQPIATFGDAFQIWGKAGSAAPQTQSGSPQITLYWKALGDLPKNPIFAVSLIDSTGNQVAHDERSTLGGWPATTQWQAGSIYADHRVLTSQTPIKPGTYTIEAQVLDGASPLPVDGLNKMISIGQVIITSK